MEHAKGAPKKAKIPARVKKTNEIPVDAAAFDEKVDEKVDEAFAPAMASEDVSAEAKAPEEPLVEVEACEEPPDGTETSEERLAGAEVCEESSAEDQTTDSLAEPEAESPEGTTAEPESSEEAPAETEEAEGQSAEAESPEEAPAEAEPSEEPPAESGEERLSPHELGRRGEQAARAFLRRRGLEIVATNWTCPAGEVDIVASDEHELRFIEVKTRRGTGKGFPEEAVDKEKQRKYERIAEYFLQGYESTELSIHFDVIGIITTAPDRAFLRYHRDAFSAC